MTDANEAQMADLMQKYKQKLQGQLGVNLQESLNEQGVSKEYMEFQREYLPGHISLYEKLCNLSEKILTVKPDKQKEQELLESLEISHLNITPAGAASFAFLAPLALILSSIILSLFFLKSFFFVIFFMIVGFSIVKPLGKIPIFIANGWRLKASNQMVICIFYVVTFMRHTSNLELAIRFAADHIAPPLSLDLKKVLWDVETQKYPAVKDALEAYLETWRKWNVEFIEAFHLVEASLLEGNEDSRIATLDKSLDVILTETYERMLHYAQNLKTPITMLHMLGIILPILGLVILPLVVSFLKDVRWYSISLLYNIGLPASVYYLGKNILAKRPTGYGDTDLSEQEEFRKYANISIKFGKKEFVFTPMWFCIALGLAFLLVGFSPLILHRFVPDEAGWGFGELDETSTCLRKFCLLDYRTSESGKAIGPFGLGSSILSLFVIVGLGIAIGLYYKLRSKKVIEIRKTTEQLEQEFASGLFQLGNRLGDGSPAETSFEKVGRSMEGTISGNFFQLVGMNIRRLGMGVAQAIFDPRNGAIKFFPSKLIESSMKVLIESVRKGPKVAAVALMNISRYVKEIHKVNERLKDLMSDVLSSMNSQIKFLTPVIAGIVIGITSMVTTILGKLSLQMKHLSGGSDAGGALAGGFFGQGVPTFHFQIIVGLYVVQITYILTIIANGIENGSDKLNERYQMGNNMVRASVLYSIIAMLIMLSFNFIASKIMDPSLLGGIGS
ncbi:hypothetical protein HYU13_01295 [Candidatus Woesearchaeota archaeon]|nr:hypothetical protein [Candidatus Woesearchaeota archaeon]